jgi:hypothetical protein
MTTITIQNKATINNCIGSHHNGNCDPIIAIDIHRTFTSGIDTAKHFKCSPHTVYQALKTPNPRIRMYEHDENGNRVRFIGYCRISRASHATESVDALMEHSREMMEERDKVKQKLAEQEAELAEFRAWKAEQERIRKAEEERQNAIAKAKEKLERRKRMALRKEEETANAWKRVREADMELAELLAEAEV